MHFYFYFYLTPRIIFLYVLIFFILSFIYIVFLLEGLSEEKNIFHNCVVLENDVFLNRMR